MTQSIFVHNAVMCTSMVNMVKVKVTKHWASKPYKKVVKLELAFESINFQSNGPVLSFKTIFSLLNCLLLSVVTGGK